jgi:hypothetical protein
VAAISVRGLDDEVRERLRVRAARNGRSMEAEIRETLTTAVSDAESSADLFSTLLERFGGAGASSCPSRRGPHRRGQRTSPGGRPRHACRVRAHAPLPGPDGRDLARPADEGSLVTTAITVAEVRFGLARLPEGRRAMDLR